MTGSLADEPIVARSGRSFDFAGHRVRLEGSAHDPGDRVPEVVEFIVAAIRLAHFATCPNSTKHRKRNRR